MIKVQCINHQIIIHCGDPIEFDDILTHVVKFLRHYEEDHHYDE